MFGKIFKNLNLTTSILMSVSALMELIALILYVKFGRTLFIPELSKLMMVCLILGIVLPLVALFIPYKLVGVVPFAFQFLAFLEFFASQSTYITNVFVSIDGTTFSASFIATAVFAFIAFVLTIVAMAFIKEPDMGGKKCES